MHPIMCLWILTGCVIVLCERKEVLRLVDNSLRLAYNFIPNLERF